MAKISSRPEEAFRQWYVELMQKKAYGFAQPIESNSTGLGISDLYGVTPIRQQEYWMEFKIMKDIDGEIPFEPGQLNWLYRHMNSGGVSLVAILSESVVYVFSAEYVDRTTNLIKHPGKGVRYMVKIPKRAIETGLDVFLEQLDYIIDASKYQNGRRSLNFRATINAPVDNKNAISATTNNLS